MLGKKKSERTEEKTKREMRKPIRFKIIRKEFEEKTKRDMQKPIWSEINKKEFQELARDIYNNEYNNDFKIVINKKTYDVKNEKKIWMEVTSRKTTKSETKKFHNELIQKDIDALEREKMMKVIKLVALEKIISRIFSKIQPQYLLLLICTTKMCLKKQYLNKVSQRKEN